ncbi:hypothetical protein A7A78_12190 [Aequorivita soesokkakensis]|uniref:Copper resistance protein NlpE n=1 Tax=Aequorivita soesokkakensis TaxID=1385699 RepID=A0A1A9LG32_9FLAO|nr:copper resistance protein NlpE [Aequorivita soesokkakensis]OAD91405.1 hypothetical protein A7A78_12190 [Aequorivita soesokkakensis]
MKKSIVLVAVIATFIFGCKNGEKNEISSEENIENVEASSTEMDSHNSENSLDWLGVYEGTIPCADCEGIKTTLEFRNDNTFTLWQTYMGKTEGESDFKENGTYVWDETGSKVLLNGESQTLQYKVGENQLWMLDKSGNTIEGDMAAMYILKKKAE